jgi:DNA-binding transcriptional LysR family regulator
VLEELLTKAGVYPRLPRIECASVAAVSGLLQSGDLLAAGASLQFRSEVYGGRLKELAFDLPSDPWVCGLIRRVNAPPSVAMTLFRNALCKGSWSPQRSHLDIQDRAGVED